MTATQEIISQLGATSSRLEKEKILRDNKDNVELKRVFKLTYSQDINFYLTAKSLDKFSATNDEDAEVSIEQALNFLEADIVTRKIRGNAAKVAINNMLRKMTNADATIIVGVIDKDLDCGVAEGLLNNIWGESFIYTYPVLLASKDEPKNRAKIKFPCIVQFKCDAMRGNIHVNIETGQVAYYSRNGRSLDLNNMHLDAEAIAVCTRTLGCSGVLDGELFFGTTEEERQTSNGIGNKAVHGTISDKEKLSARFVLWDAIPMDKFHEKKFEQPYNIRFSKLATGIEEFGGKKLTLVETRVLKNWDEIKAWYKEVVAKGFEGLILKNMFTVWEDDRSDDVVKMKEAVEGDFLIIGVEEGDGRRAGLIGAYIISSKPQEDGDQVVSRVGSGIKDEDQLPIEQARKERIGKIAACEYNKIIRDRKTKKRSFFLPILKEIRLDKNNPDLL